MPSLTLIVPGSLDTRTGGYAYDRRMAAGLRARGWIVEVRELDASFPQPSAAALDDAGRVLATIPDGATVMIDGLAFGAMPDQVEREASRLRLVALVHLPLAAESGLDRDVAARLEASERRALAASALVIVTGTRTVGALAGYGVNADRVAVVEPGTDPAPLARGSEDPDTVHLISVAALSPGKGHAILFEALARVPARNWRLTCAGNDERFPATVARLRAQLQETGLDDRVVLAGELDDLELTRLYDRADLFVLATRHETYGMVVAEALARGLPVIATRTGAIPELVGDDAGRVVPPGDVSALAAALTVVLGHAGLRARFAEGARRARERLPTWEDAVRKLAVALERSIPAES